MKKSEKEHRLSLLSQKRKSEVWEGYYSLAEYHQGAYECDHVSPYTKTAGNVDAEIFLMLQDWSSDGMLKGPLSQEIIEYGHAPYLKTNINLKRLLKKYFSVELKDTYGTNLFPFIKGGNMSTSIPASLMKRAATEFALPQVEIVFPKLVICFGLDTFNAVRVAVNLKKVKNVAEGIEAPFTYKGISIWLQAHPGQLGQNNRNRGGVNRVDGDWQRMASSIDLAAN